MPDYLPTEETERWVRFWVKSVREDSTVRKLKRADRCVFYEYVALARWPHLPKLLRGCLCDADGRAWTRDERAQAVGEKYATIKRAEEEMEVAGLIAFHESASVHHSSRGRLRIVNYDRYQGGINGEETAFNSEGTEEDQPSNLKASAFKSEGCEGDQPSNLKAGFAEEVASNSEGTPTDNPSGATPALDETSEKAAFTSEGTRPIEVNDVNDVEERLEVKPSKINHSTEELQEFWCQFQQLTVGGMPDHAASTIRPQLARTPIDAAVDAAIQVVAKRRGRPVDWRDAAEHCVNLMVKKCSEARRTDEAPASTIGEFKPPWWLTQTDEDREHASQIAQEMYEADQAAATNG